MASNAINIGLTMKPAMGQAMRISHIGMKNWASESTMRLALGVVSGNHQRGLPIG